MKQSFHKRPTENLVNTKVQWLSQLRNWEPAPSNVCHLETTCQQPIQNKLLCCVRKRHEMCLGQISWIVRQNSSMLPLHTSLSGLVTGVWRPLCAAFRLTESGSAPKNIASEITGTRSLPHCLNVFMAYLPMSLSYQMPSKDVLSANKGHSLAQNKWRELSKTASYWVSQLYLPFAFSVPLKDQSWCEVPQERKREENKPSAQEFCNLFWVTFMNFMSTMRKQSQVFFFSCRKKISWTSCQIPECLDQGSKQFGKKKAHRLQAHVWAIARIVPKMSVLLWPLHKLSWHVIATEIICPARLFYMLIPTFRGKLSSHINSTKILGTTQQWSCVVPSIAVVPMELRSACRHRECTLVSLFKYKCTPEMLSSGNCWNDRKFVTLKNKFSSQQWVGSGLLILSLKKFHKNCQRWQTLKN